MESFLTLFFTGVPQGVVWGFFFSTQLDNEINAAKKTMNFKRIYFYIEHKNTTFLAN